VTARLQPRLLLGFLAALTALPASGDTGQVVWAELTTVAHVSTLRQPAPRLGLGAAILFADKRGATRPEEVVIVGAHHDAKVVTLAAPQDGTANFRNPHFCRPRWVMADSTTREAPMRGTINPV